MNLLFKASAIIMFACLSAATPLLAVDYYWNNTSGTWGYVDASGNWNPVGVPGSAAGDRAFINNGRLALATSTHTFGSNALATALDEYSLQIGGAGAASGSLQQTGGAISTGRGMVVGNGDYGYFGISGGTLNVNSAGWGAVGYDPAIHPDNESIFIGNGGTGVYNQTGGTVNMTVSAAGYPDYAGTRFLMGGAGASDSLANFSGGTLNGPTFSGAVPDMAFVVGWAGNTGINTVNISGTAIVDLTHGGATPTGRFLMGNGGSNNILNLGGVSSALGGTGAGGGTLITSLINTNGAPTVVNFHGATLQASTSAFPVYGIPSFLSADRIYVYSEGAVIDTHGFNVTVAKPLEDPSLAGGSGVTGITLGSSHGAGYIGEPIVTLADSGGSGTGATARAIVDLDPASSTFGQITSLVITNPGVNYSGTVTATFTGGNPTTPIDPMTVAVATSANTSGGLRKIGAGTMTMTAANTYAGTTNVEAGTLTLSGAGSLAGGADIFNTAILNGTGSIGGNVNVRTGGTLTGSGAVGGNLTVAGLFAGSKAITGDATVQTGGVVNPGTTATTGATVAVGGNLKLQNNSTLHFDGGSTSNYDNLSVAGNVVEDASGAAVTVNIELNLSFTPTAALPLITAASLDPNSKITFTLPGSSTPTLDSYNGTTTPFNLLSRTATTLSLIPSGAITDPQWNTATGNWSDASKWTSGSPAAPPLTGNQRARFDKNLGGGAKTVTLNTSPTVSSLIFNNPGSESYTIQPSGSNSITLSSTIAKNWHVTVLGGSHAINANLNMAAQDGGSIIRLVDNSQLTLAGVVADKAGDVAGLTFNGAFDPTGGGGALGTGKLILSGANTYSGKTVINGGVLQVASFGNAGAASTLGKSSADPANLVLNAGTLRYAGVAGGSTDRGMTIAGNATIQADNNATLTGQIVGNTGTTLNVVGAGTLTFAPTATSTLNSLSVGVNTAGKAAVTTGIVALNDAENQGNLSLGNSATGVLTVSGTGQLDVRSLSLGKSGGSGTGVGGAIVQTGGIVNVWGDGTNPAADETFQTYTGINIGHNAYGYYKMAGGELNMNVYGRSGYQPIYMGLNAPAAFDQTAGVVNVPSASNILVGVYGAAVMNVTGGKFLPNFTAAQSGILVGNINPGTLNVGGGTTPALVDTAAGMINMARLADLGPSTGTVNLATNGTLKVGGVYGGNTFIGGGSQGQADFNFHGGKLVVGSGTPAPGATAFMENLTNAFVYSEGGVIDTNGFDATIVQSIADPTASGVAKIDVVGGGGSGYIGTPLVTISGGSGSGATAVAVMNGDKVDHIVITNPGSGYSSSDVLTVGLVGGGCTTPAAVSIGTGATYFASNVGGQLQKTGLGTLTLTGYNSYTGLTSVKEGGLIVSTMMASSIDVYQGARLGGNGYLTGNVNVRTGGTVDPGNYSSMNLYGNLTLANGSNLAFRYDGVNVGSIYGMSAKPVVTSGTAIVDFIPDVAPSYPTNLTVMSWGTFDTMAPGSLTPARDSIGRNTYRMDLSVPGQAIVVYSPITNEWMGPVGGTDWNYHTASNWNGYVPGASGSTDLQKQAVFGSIGTAGAVNVNGAITLGSLIFDNATAPYNLSGSTITIQSDTTAAAQITVLASPVVGHSVANNLTLNSNTDIRITQGLTISGSIGGAHAPVLYGDNLVFSGNNTYSGETVNHMVNFMLASPTGHAIPGNLDMSGAWMFMGAANQFGSTSVVNFKSGEWFLAGYNQTVAGISSENGIGVIENSHETAAPGSVVGDSVLTVNTAADCAFSGIIRDHGGATPPGYTLGLTKSGTATLTLSGPLTYTGPTTLEDGVLKIDATNVLAGDIVRGASTSGTLEVGGAATELTASGLVDIGEAVIGAGNTLTLLPTGSSTDLTIDVVSGEGTLQVLGTATLTAQSIVVDTLVIGNAGGAASAAVSAVPEPSAMLLLAIAGSLIAWFRLRKNG